MVVHLVEFTQRICLTLEVGTGSELLLQLRQGSRLRARVVPRHVGRREVADLIFDDGAVAREVSYDFFRFVDPDDAPGG